MGSVIRLMYSFRWVTLALSVLVYATVIILSSIGCGQKKYEHPQAIRSDFYSKVNKAKRGDLIRLRDGQVLVVLAGPHRVSPGLSKPDVSLDQYPDMEDAKVVSFTNRFEYDVLAHDFFKQE